MSDDKKMKSFTEWLHESVKGDSLKIVRCTDLRTTVLGLLDEESGEVFIVGNMHDLTFALNGNHCK